MHIVEVIRGEEYLITFDDGILGEGTKRCHCSPADDRKAGLRVETCIVDL